MDIFTLPEVRGTEDPTAQLLRAYGFFENVMKALDKVESFTSFGARVQQLEEKIGLETLKKVNSALGVRNEVSHGGRASEKEMVRAALTFLSVARQFLDQLCEPDQERFMGTDYDAYRRGIIRGQRIAHREKLRLELKASEHQKQRAGPLLGGIGYQDLLDALLVQREQLGQILSKLRKLGFTVDALESSVAPGGSLAGEQVRLEAIKTALARAFDRSMRLSRPGPGQRPSLLNSRAFAISQYANQFTKVPALQELKAITDAMLLRRCCHPLTGGAVAKASRQAIYAELGHRPNAVFGAPDSPTAATEPTKEEVASKKAAKKSAKRRADGDDSKIVGISGDLLLQAILGGHSDYAALLTELATVGFSVSALRAWAHRNGISTEERERLEKLRVAFARVTSRTALKWKQAAIQTYNSTFSATSRPFRELKSITDALLLLHGRHPQTGRHVPEAERGQVYVQLGHPSIPLFSFVAEAESASKPFAPQRSFLWAWVLPLFSLVAVTAIGALVILLPK